MIDESVSVVAAMVAANALTGTAEAEWENYPEIGEGDWDEVRGWVDRLAAKLTPDMDMYLLAYEALAARTEGAESETN